MSDTWAYDIARSIVEPNIEILPDGRRVFVMLPQSLVPIVAKEILKAFEKGQGRQKAHELAEPDKG